MFIPSSVPVGHWEQCGLFNRAVCWWPTTVSQPLYDPKLGKLSFSWKHREGRRADPKSPFPFSGASKSRGKIASVCTWNEGLQRNWPGLVVDCFDLWRNYSILLPHWYAGLSLLQSRCTVNNNEAVRASEASRQVWCYRRYDVCAGISHVATASHTKACYITLQSPACLHMAAEKSNQIR